VKISSALYAAALTICVVDMTWLSAQSVGADSRLSLGESETSGIDASSKLPPITAVAIDEKNSWAIEGSQAGLIVRSWPELSKSNVLPTQLEHIHDIALSPDGTMLAVAGGTPAELGAAELYHWPAGELWKRLEPHEDLIYAVAWRGDSQLFALASADKAVKIFSRTTAQCVQVLEGHSRPVLATEFLPTELGIVTAGVDESLRVWEFSLTESVPAIAKRTFTNHTRQVVDLALRPAHEDGPPVMASIGEDNTVRLWQPTIGRMMRFAKLESAPQAVCWTSDGKSLAVACRDGKVRTINPDSVEVTGQFEAVQGPAYCLAVDSSGMLLVGGAAGQLKRLPSQPVR
jgi:WD40 repeat protein